jgi:hypothetical protein
MDPVLTYSSLSILTLPTLPYLLFCYFTDSSFVWRLGLVMRARVCDLLGKTPNRQARVVTFSRSVSRRSNVNLRWERFFSRLEGVTFNGCYYTRESRPLTRWDRRCCGQKFEVQSRGSKQLSLKHVMKLLSCEDKAKTSGGIVSFR